MSEVTASATPKAPKAPKPAKSTPKELNMSDTSTAIDGAIAVTFAQAGNLQVNLPRKFKVGDTMTSDMALILDTAYARQFTNNMNANAKARSERYAKAEDDKARNDNLPFSADDVLRIWGDYQPNVSGAPRQGSLERMQQDAAKRTWFELIAEHNEAIDSGAAPVLKSTKKVQAEARPRKAKETSEADHTAAVEAWEGRQTALYSRILSTEAYAARVQRHLEAIQAEAGKGKADAEMADATADLI
jgi:hypothetical protein